MSALDRLARAAHEAGLPLDLVVSARSRMLRIGYVERVYITERQSRPAAIYGTHPWRKVTLAEAEKLIQEHPLAHCGDA